MKKEMEITIKSLEDDVSEKQVKYFPDFFTKRSSRPLLQLFTVVHFLVFLVPGFSSPTAEIRGGGFVYFLFVSLCKCTTIIRKK
jgi:hypothetical protein